jgi:Holliday junction resolvasome RuvABC DNA-binding subunit
MKGKTKGSIMTQNQFEKEDQTRTKIKDYFMTGQISSEVAVFTLRLLGFSAARAKQIVRQWASEKSNAE